MAAFRILARGDWRAGDVQVAWVESTLRMPPPVREAVEAAWTSASARPGIHLFDGPLCRVESWRVDAGLLRLALSRTSYKTFLGTNGVNAHFAERYGAEAMANALGTSAAILTADGVLAFGMRGSSVALYPDRAHPFGGCVEPRADLDVLQDLARELREEVGVTEADLTDLRCLALVEDLHLLQPEVMCIAATRLPLSTLRERLDPQEHRGLWTVRAQQADVMDALRDPTAMTPLTRLTLLLFAARAFPDPWIERTIADGC